LDELVKELVDEEERRFGADHGIAVEPMPAAPEPVTPQDNEAGEEG